MKLFSTNFLSKLLLILLACFLVSDLTHAAPNPQINYQGKLTNQSGVAVPNGTYNMRFWLLTSPSIATTSAIWTESLTGSSRVTVTNGLFSVMLGSTTSLTGINFNQTLYLGVEVGGTGSPVWDGEMSPRKILGTVPAAFVANYAEVAGSASSSDSALSLGGVSSSSFLRSDQADTMEATSSSPILSIIQNGAGAIARFFSGVTEVFTILSNGNVGVGTSTPGARLSVAGDALITGTSTLATTTVSRLNLGTALSAVNGGTGLTSYATGDLIYASGANTLANRTIGTVGQVLQVVGGLPTWSATSSLGLGDGTFLGLTDTPSSYTANRLFFTNSGATAVTDSANLVFDGTNFGIGSTTPNSRLTVTGNAGTANVFTFASSTNTNLLTLTSTGRLTFGSSASANILLNGGATTTNPQNNQNNIAIGNQAFSYYGGSANNNIALGFQAIYGSTTVPMTGSSNFAAGYQPLYRNTTGSDNIAIGSLSLHRNTTGDDNNALGTVTLTDNTTGSYNNAFGYRALRFNTTGSYNNAFSRDALYNNTIGDNNNAVGDGSLYSNTTGSNNNVLGTFALGLYNGTGTIAIGYQAGDALLSGSNNIIIGYDIDFASTTMNNALNIGNLIYATGMDGTGTTLSTGNFGIGTTTPLHKLTVAGNTFIGGNLTVTNASTTGVTATNLYSNNLNLLGQFRDGASASGTLGMILQTTGTSTRWTATSSLGLGNGTFLGLSDTPSSYTANRLFFTNSAATAVTNSANLVFDGTNFGIGSTTPTARLTVTGNAGTANVFTFASSTNTNLLTLTSTGRLTFGSSANANILLNGGSTTTNPQTNGDNVAIGNQAFSFYSSSAIYNTAIGFRALYGSSTAPMTGVNNIAVGANALSMNTSGSGNNAFGASVLSTNTSGTANNALGSGALSSNTTGSFNNALGSDSLLVNITGSGNNAFGLLALSNNTTGSDNNAFGSSALSSYNGTGTIAIGYQVGDELFSGSNNIILGYDIDFASTTMNNALNIGNLIYATGMDGIGTTLSTGNFGIGTTTPSHKLTVAGNTFIGGNLTTLNASTTGLTATNIYSNNLNLLGQFRDGASASGTLGMILQTTGTSTRWVATSSLGIAGGASTFLALTDTPSSYTANRLLFTNSGATAVTDSANLVFDGTNFGIGSTTPNAKLTVVGTSGSTSPLFTVASSTGLQLFNVTAGGRVGIGSSTPSQKLTIDGGSIALNNTTTALNGIVYKDGVPFIHNFNYGFNGVATTSGNNTFVGLNAGNLTMGSTASESYEASYNTALGANALFSNTTGYYNTALGSDALYANTIGGNNIALGRQALYTNTEGNSNLAFGSLALFANTEGSFNIAIGSSALTNNATGSQNTAIGNGVLETNTSGSHNTALGSTALYFNTTGSYNTANGVVALNYNTSGSYNIAMGAQALYNNTEGSFNTALGAGSLQYNSTGTTNTAVGVNTGWNLADDIAQYQISVDTNMVLLGHGATKNNASVLTNGIAIGAGAFVLESNQAVIGNDSITSTLLKGNVGLGTTTPSHKLTVVGNTYIGGNLTTLSASTTNLALSGRLYDSTSSAGTLGMVLQATGTSTRWVATSTLGISSGASTFLSLTDTPSSYTANRLFFTNSAATAVTDSANLVFDGTNFGIGSTTPNAKLTVVGTSGSTTPLFTIASSTNVSLLTVLANGNVGISSSTPIAKFSLVGTSGSTQNLFTLASSTGAQFFNVTSAGNVGIGSTTPGFTLGVAGTLGVTGFTTLANASSSVLTANTLFASQGNITNASTTGLTATNLYSNNLNLLGQLRDGASATGTIGMVLQTTGTSTRWVATSTLGITGGSSSFLALTDTPDAYVANRLFFTNSGGTALVDSPNLVFTGTNFGIGTSTPGSLLTVASSTISATAKLFSVATTSIILDVLANGNVGLGSSTPSQQLTLTRSMSLGDTVDTTTGVIYKAGESFIHNFRMTNNDGGNLYVGKGAGNFTMGSSTGFSYFGSYNTGVGEGTLTDNTLGYANSALGSGVLGFNTTGYYNSGSGANALLFNTTGYENTATGYSSLLAITSGSSNTALGYQAGYGDGTTGNQQSVIDTYGTFLGYQASRDASVSSTTILTNITAIGKNARVGCNNCLVLGGIGADAVNVGIGSTTPSSKLSVVGTSGSTNSLFTISSSTGAQFFSVTSVGNVGISSSTPSAKFSLVGTSGSTNNLFTLASSTGLQLFNITSAGNVGIGSTTPGFTLGVAGTLGVTGLSTFTNASTTGLTATNIYSNNLNLLGQFRDGASASGTIGMVLQTTGTSTRWVATSTLGITGGASTFLALTDTPSSYTANRLFFTNSAATAVTDSANLVFDGTNFGIGSTTPSSKLSVVGTSGSTTALFAVASSTGLQLFNITSAGRVGIGTSTPVSQLAMERLAFTGSGTAGIDQVLGLVNTTASAVQYGNKALIRTTNTATTTIVGQAINIQDSTVYGNTVRGFEVQADLGNNTLGENTAISGYARTFGVKGITSGDAGGTFEPAGVIGETSGTNQGNAIRGFSSSITTAALLKLFQASSTFNGTGLLMSFGNSGGSFASTTASKFVDFQNAGTSMFTVGAYGALRIGDGTTAYNSGLSIGNGGICVDSDGTCVASTTGRITAVSYTTANSDLAENYFSSENLKTGDVVYLKGGLSVGRANQSTAGLVLGVVSTAPGLTLGENDSSLTGNEKAFPIALAGRVPVKLSNENGPIKAGDELMLSSLPGTVMKASSTGTIVGIALEDFDETRAYSDTYINQFGENIIIPNVVPINRVADSRLNDGCYYGAGNASGDEPCVPLKATTIEAQLVEADALALETAKEIALRDLARTPSETVTINSQSVKVGQIVMFVNLRYRYLAEDSQTMIEALSMNASGENAEGEIETVWSRLVTLANNFVDGILSVLTLKADRVETKELCVDGVCVTADDLRNLLERSGEITETEEEVDQVQEEDEDVPEEVEEESGGGEEEEVVATSTDDGTEGGEIVTEPETGDETIEEVSTEETEVVPEADIESEVIEEEPVEDEESPVSEESNPATP